MEPGTILLGKYRIEDLLGVGGMGRVVRATHLYLNQAVAIKILLPEMAETASRERFLREAQATVRLRSEHIARVMDVATLHDGIPLMVMEYLEGNDLNQILRHHGPQAPAIVCDLMLQACEGIAEAHSQGIIHRDIKPSNFFITRRPDGSMLLKILDFGISKTPIGYTELTGTESVIGTPTYMAPEQMKNSRDIDARCDVWSIGVVMYQLLTGRPPFAGEGYAELVLKVAAEPPEPIQVALPPGLAEVILRCLEKNPAQRFQNVGELARMIAPYATDPIAGAATATRTARILSHRQSTPGMHLAGPLPNATPLSPALLTPQSWHQPNNPTSVSGGAGQQLTHVTRGGRGWLIAGVATLCVLTGIGGYAASKMLADKPAETSAAAVPESPPPPPASPTTPPTTPEDKAGGAPTTPPPPPPTTPTIPPTDKAADKPADKVADKPVEKPADKTPAKTATTADKTTTAAKTEPKTTPKSTTSRTTTTKSTTKSTKSTATKSTKSTKSTKTTKGTGDLFDSRD